MMVPLVRYAVLVIIAGIGLSACAGQRPSGPSVEGPPTPGRPPAPGRPAVPPPPTPRVEAPLPETFESADFIVALARSGDTARSLAGRHLGDPGKAWMIEEYAGAATFAEGQQVVIPKHDWNPVGVYPSGYQLVPVLVYHDIGRERKGRLRIAVRMLEEQLRHLHAEGFRTISIADFIEFNAGRRQLPRKSVLLAFDDGYRSFVQFALPMLKELGFRATLFVYTDYIGAGANALTWRELRDLAADGFDVQAHSKTHHDLVHKAGESDADYAKRIEVELGVPLALFRRHLGRGSETLAYPYGTTDDELVERVAKHGYVAAFTVRREANPAFAFPRKLSREQIYADMTFQQFARSLTVSHDEPLDALVSTDQTAAVTIAATAPPATTRGRLAAPHRESADALERAGRLRQAFEELAIAVAIDPQDPSGPAALTRLRARIDRTVSALIEEGRSLLGRSLHADARRRFLAALAVAPTNHAAFEALQNDVREITYIIHKIRSGDTFTSLAEIYYGDPLRADVLAETNGLLLNARLQPGKTLRIPEIPGVPMLPH
jgi:peptidoglycan/xylan/chitin deacetylase (PgdA/CDA1 family)